MPKVKDILEFVEQLAPPYMAMDWDHIGLLCGRSDREVKRIMVALDPFMAAAQEAVEQDCQLLLTHHPSMWNLEKFNDETQQGRVLLYLVENGISAVNAHTNLDCAPGGVNDCLASVLGLEQVRVLNPEGVDAQGRPWGLLRAGLVEQTPLKGFLDQIKQRLGCPGLRYADGGRPVRQVAVGGGACADGVREVFDAGCDTFVTADVKYNQFWDARDLGLNLVDAGHFWTENPVCDYLAAQLQAQFPEILVKVSEHHRDCIKFW